MDTAAPESRSGSNSGKLVVRVVVLAVLGGAIYLAYNKEYIPKKNAEDTAAVWRESLKTARSADQELTQADLENLIQGEPSVADATAGDGQTAETFSWPRILGDDYQIKVTYDNAVTPSVASIEPLWGKS